MNTEYARIFDEMYDAIFDDSAKFCDLYNSHPEMRKRSPWLYNAARGGDFALVAFLLNHGHSPNETSGGTVEQNALCGACGEASPECVQLLLNAGASTDMESIGKNALLSAITGRSLTCAKMLVDAGIDIHKTYELEDGRLRNALEFAEHWGCPDIAEYLRSQGAVLPEENLPEENINSRGDITRKARILSSIRSWFGSEQTKPLGSVALGKGFGDTELYWLDIASADFPFLTVFTHGLFEHLVEARAFDEERSRIELMMHLPFTWPMEGERASEPEYQWPLEWIRMLSQNILDGTIPLPGTHVIISNDEPPQPLGPGTDQTPTFDCRLLRVLSSCHQQNRASSLLSRCSTLHGRT